MIIPEILRWHPIMNIKDLKRLWSIISELVAKPRKWYFLWLIPGIFQLNVTPNSYSEAYLQCGLLRKEIFGMLSLVFQDRALVNEVNAFTTEAMRACWFLLPCKDSARHWICEPQRGLHQIPDMPAPESQTSQSSGKRKMLFINYSI